MQQPPSTEQLTTADDAAAAPVREEAAPVREEAPAKRPVPKEQLLISATPFETRLAVMSQGLLQELHVTPAGGDSEVGTIALGKVLRVLPGMQAAFVELGLERPGFLHARDIERPGVAEDGSVIEARDIRKLLHEGQVLPVQVAKDPIASKGARLTTNLALPSRFLVLTPGSRHIGISQRIDDDSERDRLRDLVVDCVTEVALPAEHGFIVRTAAEGVERAELLEDMKTLFALWQTVESNRVAAKSGEALFRDLPTHIRVLRDLVGVQTALICVDDPAVHEAVVQFVGATLPDYHRSIKLASADQPLFERHGVEQQIRAALGSRVGLPSGGYLIVEQTEAMITVDVNTGSFTGSNSLEETVFQTNMEAARALPRQFRLRNLGGLVVVDFIDMESAEHRECVVRELRAGCSHDAAKVRISSMSGFGLVELSRKRTRESLVRQFCEPCGTCGGAGVTARPTMVAFEILRALDANRRAGTDLLADEFLIIATDPVINLFLKEEADSLATLARELGVTVRLQSDQDLAPGDWELVHRLAQAPKSS